MNRAFFYRGDGFADKVKPEAWPKFHHYVEEARRELERSERFATDDPHWHGVALQIALFQGRERVELSRIELRALNVDPFYGPTHRAMLLARLPAWGGSWAEVDDAIDLIVARTAGESGRSFYAISYAYVSKLQLRRRLFEKSRATWPRMKQGFEELIARRPTSWNLNIFAVNACYAEDWDTFRALLDRLGGRYVDELWVAKSVQASCVGSMEAVRREAEDAVYFSKPMPVAQEMAERLKIEQEATAALLDGRFDEIERERARLLASKERTASGAWKLIFYTEGLTPSRLLLPGSEDAARKVRDQIAAWKLSRPASIAAALADIRLDVYDGRLVRGLKAEPTDVGHGRSKEAKFVERARRGLVASKAWGERDPVWWSLLMLVNTDDIVTDGAFVQDAFAALAVEPTYDATLDTILARASFGPKFGETHDKMLALVLHATSQDQADETYADAFLRLGDRWGGDNIVQNLNVDWPRMRRGLEAIVARWPTDWNLSAYARFACMAKDKPTAAALLSRLGDRVVWLRWTNWRGQNECRSWTQAAQ